MLECRLANTFELGLHMQFVGEIVDVKADDEVLDAAGVPDLAKLLPIVLAPACAAISRSRSVPGQGVFGGQAIGRDFRA